VTQQDVDQAGALYVGPMGERAAAPVSEAIDRARAGDPRELEAIARRELPRVGRLLRRLLGPRADMEDLVQNVFAKEQLRRVDVALSKIAPDKRIAFVLWAVDGKDVDTIAQMVGASVAATRSRIHYAQRELKALAAGDPYLSDLVGAPDAG